MAEYRIKYLVTKRDSVDITARTADEAEAFFREHYVRNVDGHVSEVEVHYRGGSGG